MANPLGVISQKLYRAGEAARLLLVHAGDAESRRVLWDCYASLSQPDRYNEMVQLRVKVDGRIFPFRMRRSDLFTLGELLHEGQYRLVSQLPPAPTIVDAGANIGVSGVWFLGRYPGANLHAFEPARENFELLTANLGHLEQVKLFRAAVGAAAGTATLHHFDFAAMYSLVSSEAQSGSEIVPVISLAEHMKAHSIGRIDLLKLDVEGSELDALIGLREKIADIQVIVGEMHEAVLEAAKFYAFLESRGFRVLWKRYFRGGREQRVHGFEAARVP